ncbi:glyceraldehyde-3-phosphate dehydrogenase-like [Trichosurus vulpecula]|uniref:glyceraldehyde-3-phosphate dehydrogenase-like n=1 Tax=Trichosurus vulpecula TaxID=9337 RepID=UPI00186B4A5C|nr:glyceraldehyde-3-phosphate dehydrogenase-like [Trichosurus vulpecula]
MVTGAAHTSDRMNVMAINDLFISINYMVYMFQNYSTHSKFKGIVKTENGKLVIKGKAVPIFQEHDSIYRKLQDPGAKSAIKSTAVCTTMEKAKTHSKGETKCVIIAATSADVPMFVMRRNREKFDNFLLPALLTTWLPWPNVIHNNLGFMGRLMNTVTDTQKRALNPSGMLWCDVRSTAENNIPPSTGAAKTVGKIIPELNGKFIGMAFCVPTPKVSVMSLTCHLEKPAQYDDFQKVLKQPSDGPLKNILGYTEGQVIFYNFSSDTQSSICNE